MVAGVSGLPSIPFYRRFDRQDVAAELKKIIDKPQTKKAIEDFKKRVANVKTAKEFVEDPKLLNFALTAYGLKSEIQYAGRARQAVLSDYSNTGSLVRKLRNGKLTALTIALDFVKQGVTKVKSEAFLKEITDKYAETIRNEEIENFSPAVASALYFKKAIGKVSTHLEILADVTLRDVVYSALNIPQQTVNLSVSKQIKVLEAKLDIKKVTDGTFVEKLATQFLARQDAQAAQTRRSPALILLA